MGIVSRRGIRRAHAVALQASALVVDSTVRDLCLPPQCRAYSVIVSRMQSKRHAKDVCQAVVTAVTANQRGHELCSKSSSPGMDS